MALTKEAREYFAKEGRKGGKATARKNDGSRAQGLRPPRRPGPLGQSHAEV